MITNHDQVATKADVQNFAKDAMVQFDHLVLDEKAAKMGMLVVMASGSNGVFVGEPGGGKTTLAENSHRIIEGIANEDRAIIPPEADLKPRQMVGGNSTVTRTIGGVAESISTETQPIITPDTKVIWADEINRGAPHAINALLGALGSRKFSNTAGEVELNDLEYAISTMNPGGLNEGVFKINPANASRHAVGALMGLEEDKEVEMVIDNLLEGWRSEPEKVQPITDLQTLHAIRNYIKNGNVAFAESLRAETKDKLQNTKQVLGENGIHEAYPRLTIQVVDNAKALAALRGEDGVTREDVSDAIKYVVTSRIGMRKPNPETEVPKAIASIL